MDIKQIVESLLALALRQSSRQVPLMHRLLDMLALLPKNRRASSAEFIQACRHKECYSQTSSALDRSKGKAIVLEEIGLGRGAPSFKAVTQTCMAYMVSGLAFCVGRGKRQDLTPSLASVEGALQSGARAARDIVIRAAEPCLYAAMPPGGSGYSGGGGRSGGGGSTDDY